MAKFWTRSRRTPNDVELDSTRGDQGTDTPSTGLEQAALDQLANVLSIWGEFAFDLEEVKASAIRDQMEAWVRHVLVAAPIGSRGDTTEPQSGADKGQRNWPALREFVTRVRRREQDFVKRQIVGTREVMGEFVQTLGQALAEDQEEQNRVTSVIEKLRSSIQNNTPLEVLKGETLGAINLITGIAKERERRHQSLLNQLTDRLQTLRNELDAAQHEMELDPLTRLYNRKAFDIQLERVFELNKLSGLPACLAMIDADHFKSINDRFGHQTGDIALRRLADCCTQNFPRKTDFIARYGGEEFVLVLQDTPIETARLLTERLAASVRALEIEAEQGTLQLTVSIGLAELHPHTTAQQWLRACDGALYEAKRKGRDRISLPPGC